MKKIIIYLALLGAALLVPVKGTDVGKLVPVELIKISKEGDAVVLTTDLGESGVGMTVREAIENLKATTSGIIFLDTADYLLVDDTAQGEEAALAEYLKPSVRVCAASGDLDLKEAAAFLRVHRPEVKLKHHTAKPVGQILAKENGKMILKNN